MNLLPASDLALCLPWAQRTVCTVRYSETIGAVNRISNTTGVVSRMKSHTFGFLIFSLILAVSHFILSCCFITLPLSSSCSLSLCFYFLFVCFYFKFFCNTKFTHGICFCGFSSVILLDFICLLNVTFRYCFPLLLYWSVLYLCSCQAVSF